MLFLDCDISPKTYDERDSEIRTSKRKIQWFANGTTLVVYQILATDDWSEFMSHMPVTPCCIHLEICDKQIDNKDVEILSQITHEVHLSLTNCATTPGILASLQMSNLHSLHLTHCNFAVEDFPFLSHCSNLHALYLVSCTVNSEIFRIISQLPLEQLLIVDVKPKLNNNFTRRQAGDSASPRWGENDEMPGGVPSRRAVRTDSLGVQHFRERNKALETLETLKTWLQSSPLLLEDFPEICFPISILKTKHTGSVAESQSYRGTLTRVVWARDEGRNVRLRMGLPPVATNPLEQLLRSWL